jgi:hypothetical protein
MGWDVVVLDRPFDGVSLATGSNPPAPSLPDVLWIGVAEAAHWLNDGAACVAIMPSAEYRKAHPEAAVWAIRPRLDRLPASVLRATRIAVFADDDAVLSAGGGRPRGDRRPAGRAGAGRNRAWRAAARPFTASPDEPPVRHHSSSGT